MYAVIFSAQRSEGDDKAYGAMAKRMVALAREQPGFIGVESARDSDGFGITVSYWRDQESIKKWREHLEHQKAQHMGKTKWYASYTLRIAKVESEYEGP